jgi:hypothetical protein
MSPDTISKYVYEDSMARFERHIKRQWIAILILLAALIGTNAGWLWYESQFQMTEITKEVKQDVQTGDGDLTITGIGDIYGTSETESNN